MPTWKVKTDENGAVALKDGLPVWIDDKGAEAALDPNQLHRKIVELGNESKERRLEAEKLRERFAPVAEIEDLAKYVADATTAGETIKNLEEHDLRKVENVAKVKRDIAGQFEDQQKKLKEAHAKELAAKAAELDALNAKLHRHIVVNRFALDPHFSGPEPITMLPPDIAADFFAKYFKVIEQNGDLVPVCYVDGEPLYSRERPGEFAPFAEAVKVLIDRYPFRDRLLRATPAGSGASGGLQGTPAQKGNRIAQLEEAIKKAQEKRDGRALVVLENALAEAKNAALAQHGRP